MNTSRFLKMALGLTAAFFLAGCEYEVPIATTSLEPIDQRLLGIWEKVDSDTDERALILKLSDTEYLVHYPLNQDNGHYFRTTLTRVDGIPFLQMLWIGTAEGVVPPEKRKYTLATYETEGDRAGLKLLNSADDMVSKEMTSSKEIIDAIKGLKQHPELFRDPIVFRKIK